MSLDQLNLLFALLRKNGITIPQLIALLVVHKAPQEMSEISRSTKTSTANCTGMVDRLEGKGLVERGRDKHDRRRVLVALTPKGTDLTNSIITGISKL